MNATELLSAARERRGENKAIWHQVVAQKRSREEHSWAQFNAAIDEQTAAIGRGEIVAPFEGDGE